MILKKTSVAICVAAIALSACVSPDVVQKNGLNDEALTCGQIQEQIGQLDQIRAEAKKGKTASGANVAAAIFFWPAVIGNYANANEALEAANKRQEVLVGLYKRKRCK